MFALRRSSLRLATNVPFSRPPRISAPFSDQPAPSDPLNPFSSPPSSSIDHIIPHTANEMIEEMIPDVLDRENPFVEGDAPPPLVYRFHCFSSRTNTRTTFTAPNGNVVAWFSGGSCGFKKRNRSSYEAGYQCAVRMFEKIQVTAQQEPFTIALFLKGFGFGRDALMKAIMTQEGQVVRSLITSITDRSPLKIGGTRAKKMKRR